MRVRCIKLINPNTGQAEQSSPWRTIGKVYDVLEIWSGLGDSVLKFRLESDDGGSPTLSRADLFEGVSDFIPSTWAAKTAPGEFLILGPRAWQVEGFWVAYFDGEQWARELYRREVEKMVAEEEFYLKSRSDSPAVS